MFKKIWHQFPNSRRQSDDMKKFLTEDPQVLEGHRVKLSRLEFVHACLKTFFTCQEHNYIQTPTYLLFWGLLPWDILPICSLVKFLLSSHSFNTNSTVFRLVPSCTGPINDL